MSEATMIEAHKAGIAYWEHNKPTEASRESLESLARSCGWHGEDSDAWLAGFYGARRRDGKPEAIDYDYDATCVHCESAWPDPDSACPGCGRPPSTI